MGKRVRERDKEKRLAPSKRKAKSKLVDGPVTTDWNKTLTQFTAAYLNQINLNLTQNTGQAQQSFRMSKHDLRARPVFHHTHWTARCFSDSACFVLQAAFFRSRNSLSTSSGVRYPRAE